MEKIGFVGLGNMGLLMSRNLVAANFTVYGIDKNKEAEVTFEKAGGIIAATLIELAQSCGVIFTNLPSSNVVESIYLESQGLIENARSNLILIDTSTVSPESNIKIANAAKKKGIDFLAAPFSGGAEDAMNRTLTFMVGGSKGAYERALPIMRVLGENIFHVSEQIESGTTAKLINNLLIGFYTAGVSEALHLAKESGMNLEQLFHILNGSDGQSRIYERNYKSFIANDNYEPGLSLKSLNKELAFTLELARIYHVDLPISKTLLAMYQEMEKSGFGEKDISVLYKKVSEQTNGTSSLIDYYMNKSFFS